VVGIERPNHALIHPQADTRLEAGDILLVDIAGTLPGKEIFHELGLDVLSLRGSYFTDQSRDVGMAELVVPPESPLLGKTLVEANVRTRYRLHVVGLRRGGRAREGGLLTMRLRPGDTLLVIGQWKAIWSQQAPGSDFVVLSLPAEVDQAAPAGRQAPLALLSLGMMVTLMVTGVVPNVTAALLAVLLMGLFRCVTFETAYRSIHWPSLLLIVGVMPFAVALQKTGGIALAAEGLMFFFGEASPHVLLGALFLLTALTGLFISNTATAVLMAPIALSLAAQLNLSPYPFAMTVALAASAAFMTPVSSPVNTLVLGPGKYRFGDFVRIGVPFTLLVMVATVILVPWLFPLK
jgi:di/tricarboxylate transporter